MRSMVLEWRARISVIACCLLLGVGPGAAAESAPSGEKAPTAQGLGSSSKKEEQRGSPAKPEATYPGFRVLPNGSSRVWLRISRKVDVTAQHGSGRSVYLLPKVQVGNHNNTHPLVTTYFKTPLAWARLLRVREGARLVLEFREPVQPKHQVFSSGEGMVLRIDLPPPKRSHSTPVGRKRRPSSKSTPRARSGSPPGHHL